VDAQQLRAADAASGQFARRDCPSDGAVLNSDFGGYLVG
jgi:hypothetical protein